MPKCLICQKEFDYNSKKRKIFCSSECSVQKLPPTCKLEVFLKNKLQIKYPFLDIRFNDKTLIGYELDIYFPQLKLAIEIQGPTHFKPIYGQKTLDRTQLIDQIKKEKCKDIGVTLQTLYNYHKCNTKETPFLCLQQVEMYMSWKLLHIHNILRKNKWNIPVGDPLKWPYYTKSP